MRIYAAAMEPHPKEKTGIESADPTTRDGKRRVIVKAVLDLLNTAIDVASSRK